MVWNTVSETHTVYDLEASSEAEPRNLTMMNDQWLFYSAHTDGKGVVRRRTSRP